jgi:CheY-like chemotaxis protein
VKTAAAFRPGLVLMDLAMPEMDGFMAAKAMRREDWGKSIVLVALTGWANDDDRRRTQEAGFDFHLVKPVSVDALRELFATGDLSPSF